MSATQSLTDPDIAGEMLPPDDEDIRECALLKLGNSLFAIEVKAVREFLEPGMFTEIPQAPHHVLGLIHIRGENIAVVDLAQKLGLPAIEPNESSRIVILEIPRAGGTNVVGALTDGVLDVTILDEEHTQNMPDIGSAWNADFIRHIARYHDQIVIVLDVEKIFNADDLGF